MEELIILFTCVVGVSFFSGALGACVWVAFVYDREDKE